MAVTVLSRGTASHEAEARARIDEAVASDGQSIDLSALLPRLQSQARFAELLASLGTGDNRARRLSIADPAKAYVVAALHRNAGASQGSLGRRTPGGRPVVLLTARPGHARQFWEELASWAGEGASVLHFPAPDALPYEQLPDDPSNIAERVRVLSALAESGSGSANASAPLVVLCARAALELVQAPERFRAASRVLRVGDRIRQVDLIDGWVAGGYEPSPLVDGPGQFSRRGGIVDVYPPAGPPCRIEFFGDEIESLREFDAETQRSGERLTELRVPPARIGASDKMSDETILHATFFDHVPAEALVVLDEPPRIETVARELEQQAEELRVQLAALDELGSNVARPYLPWPEVRERLRGSNRPAIIELLHEPASETIPFSHAQAYAGRLKTFLDQLGQGDERRRGEAVVVVSQQSARLQELLAERGIDVVPSERVFPRDPLSPLSLVHGSLPEGWRSEALGITLLTDGELFGWRKVRRPVRRSRGAAREAFLSDLESGELVVHVDHGIGRFRGLVRPPRRDGTSGSGREFLLLEFAEGDRVYVPSEQSDRVSRYVGGGDDAPHLTRLGTQEWTRAKARARRAVRDIARDLLQLYAARRVAKGYAFGQDTVWQRELEDSFPYVETPDQARAVTEVKRDMEEPEPMDRLLVGDVGYGKTEVALRAAFKAVADGRQVAVLVPTTVLAQQHFTTFQERYAPFPVRVEVLSRFRSPREQRAVVDDLAAGKVDVCIGTHRLVQKDVHFKNLGLVIIDEEQRFGVAHKERLKQLRTEVDVLTLTATPIPRTLHMSLAGVRDMSVIETAPEDRLPIRTYVAEYDDGMVREVILRELDRGGQIYFVHNRVHSIEFLTHRLQQLVPEARFVMGHGQMTEDRLEQVMVDFANGEADVLVCTTIIESGLDIANANTMIINDADRFGLAQLYQLRGRIGRGGLRAYAYFLYARDTRLTEQAEARLRTIFEATELGAGFRIAMKDLEIRGAGNLLGAEQSGQIAAVGFDLYTRLLSEAIDLQRAADGGTALETLPDATAPETRPSVDLPIEAFLPSDYVVDEASRLNLYQRLASAASVEQVGELAEEIQDRFGGLPEAAQNLLFLVDLRLQAQRAGVSQISASESEIVVKFRGRPPQDASGLARQVGAPVHLGSNQLRFPRGRGQAWLTTLQQLVDHLPVAA